MILYKVLKKLIYDYEDSESFRKREALFLAISALVYASHFSLLP